MSPDLVVDIGNSRIKWWRPKRVEEQVLSFPHSSVELWEAQLAKWGVPEHYQWAIASVNPVRLDEFRKWLESHEFPYLLIESYHQIPLDIRVEHPQRVGLDRLLGAVAARARTPQNRVAITVDVGTAVTVNLVDEAGCFRGGAIFPGPQLMANALHHFTAALPLVELPEIPNELFPGIDTPAAIRTGIQAAISGGIERLLDELVSRYKHPGIFLTGGGRGSLSLEKLVRFASVQIIPELNLEGILRTAEMLP